MGLLDKAKGAAQEAAARAKEGVEDVQTKRELGSTFEELGKKAFELLEQGSLEHSELDPLAARIRELQAKLADTGAKEETATTPPSDAPPAMPT